MAEHVHTIVIGAGAIGLAIARRLAPRAGSLVVLEREAHFGSATSSRSSEVVHAGMYYAPGSLKARSCVAGRRQLVAYCRERGVPHRLVGKLIVATEPAHLPVLRDIAERAVANGLTAPGEALQWLSADAAAALEPALRCTAALWSPATGILDTHAFMLACLADAEHAGALLATGTRFTGARREGAHWRVSTEGEGGAYELLCTHLVNAAGLQAQQVAACIGGLAPAHIPAPLWLKGNYFALSGVPAPFSRLVYPVPSGGGLGVHCTLDLGGQTRFGPDTEAMDPSAWAHAAPDYTVDPRRAERFYGAIRRYWPALPEGSLQPAYAGIRPKLAPRAESGEAPDFDVSGPRRHGLPGLVQLFGIESPGITAAMALADEVAAQLAP